MAKTVTSDRGREVRSKTTQHTGKCSDPGRVARAWDASRNNVHRKIRFVTSPTTGNVTEGIAPDNHCIIPTTLAAVVRIFACYTVPSR